MTKDRHCAGNMWSLWKSLHRGKDKIWHGFLKSFSVLLSQSFLVCSSVVSVRTIASSTFSSCTAEHYVHWTASHSLAVTILLEMSLKTLETSFKWNCTVFILMWSVYFHMQFAFLAWLCQLGVIAPECWGGTRLKEGIFGSRHKFQFYWSTTGKRW